MCNATPVPSSSQASTFAVSIKKYTLWGGKHRKGASYQRVERVLIIWGGRRLSSCTRPLSSTCRKKGGGGLRNYQMWDFLVIIQSQEMANQHFRPLPNRGQSSFPLPCNSSYSLRGLLSSQVQMHHFLWLSYILQHERGRGLYHHPQQHWGMCTTSAY